MIGIVLVSHGKLGQEFIKIAEHIMGPQENIMSISMEADEDPDKKRTEILDAIKKSDTGNGCVVLTDMFGGTPSNLAISLMEHAKIEVIAGFNLPLLIKLLSVRKSKPLHHAVVDAAEAGKKYIHIATHILTPPGASDDKPKQGLS